jgi:hypothetical protein
MEIISAFRDLIAVGKKGNDQGAAGNKMTKEMLEIQKKQAAATNIGEYANVTPNLKINVGGGFVTQ